MLLLYQNSLKNARRDVNDIMGYDSHNSNGYIIRLFVDKCERARLVYETFVRPLEKDERIVCINGNRRDLRLENLTVQTVTEVNNTPDRIAKDKASKYATILLQPENSDEVIEIVGYVNAQETCGIHGGILRRKIRQTEREGKSYITHKKTRYEFIVERSARYDNYDPNNARKKAA